MKKLSRHIKTAVEVAMPCSILAYLNKPFPSYSQSASGILPTKSSSPIATPKPGYWLILINAFSNTSQSIEEIEMQSMEQCEAQGNIWKNSFNPNNEYPVFASPRSNRQFLCLEGKPNN